MEVRSYPSLYGLGHKAVRELLLDPVLVEEKVDGSQFSFGLLGGQLKARSKSAQINMEAPDNLFSKAVAHIKTLPLTPEYVYRGEWLSKPKHNTINYTRTPAHGIVLFDVETSQADFLPPNAKLEEAKRLGLEVVPLLYEGRVDSKDHFLKLLDTESFLGGSKVEGVVIKNYARFGLDKHPLMGKYVSEAFKEQHSLAWKDSNSGQADILTRLSTAYAHEGRWQKAVQHLAERGTLDNSPRDIGALFKEVPADIEKECKEEILAKLWEWAWPTIRRGTTKGLPEWYKASLLTKQFPEGASTLTVFDPPY